RIHLTEYHIPPVLKTRRDQYHPRQANTLPTPSPKPSKSWQEPPKNPRTYTGQAAADPKRPTPSISKPTPAHQLQPKPLHHHHHPSSHSLTSSKRQSVDENRRNGV